MKNSFLTKIGAVLISAAMLVGSMTSVCAEIAATDATSGYFWLEGEDGAAYGEWDTLTDASCNGEKYRRMATNNAAEGGNRIEYKINVTDSGKYKTYIRSTMAGNEWMSEAKLYIDGAEVALTKASAETWYAPAAMQWFTGAEVSLDGGEHTVVYKLEAPRPHGNDTYVGALDSIAIMPSDYTMAQDINARPVAPKTYASNWFEETDAISKSGAYYSVSGSNLSGGKALQTSMASAPGADGYNVDFATNIKNAGEYDIYYRSNIPQEWMSKPDLFVDGVKQSGAKVTDEGWFGQLTLGWNKATVSLAKGEHTIRWTLIDSRTASTNNWIGMFDCMAILPKDMPFAITGGSIADTKIDYELCAAAADINLKAVTGDIVLPSETESGIEITWTSSDPEIISEDGKVTRGAEDKEVRLTAATPDDYEKTFTLTVKKLAEFDVESFYIMGNVAAGEAISANAELKCGLEDSKKAMLIIALYTKDGEMIAANIDSKNITAEGTTLNTGLTVPANIAEGAYATAYLWNDIDDLKPIMPAISK